MSEIAPDNLESTEQAKTTGKENAEANLRAAERSRTPPAEAAREQGTQPSPSEPAPESGPAADTSGEWWNRSKPTDKPQPTMIDQAKRIAVIGAAGALVIGSILTLGQDGLPHSPGNNPEQNNIETTQNVVVEKPNASQDRFVVSNEPVSLAQHDATSSASVEPAAAQWWHDVPAQSQRALKYKGDNTAYGCAPTSASMIADYWHQKDQANPTISAQDLVDANVKQGEFTATGMSATNLHDELGNLGYVTEDHVNSGLEDLKSAVSDGPVMAIVKLDMAKEGPNHTVVVTGISDKNEVRVNDPWTGESKTYSWEKFSQSWGANFGKDAPRNSFTTIHPK